MKNDSPSFKEFLIKYPLILVILAFSARLLYLTYNLSLNLPQLWFSVVTASITAAEQMMGVASSGLYDPVASMNHFKYEIRGPAVLHMVDIALFGRTSLLRLSFLGIILDSLMTLVVFDLAKKLKGQRFALLAGFLYALSPLHIFMSYVPSWYTWMNAGTLLFCFILLKMLKTKKSQTLMIWIVTACVLASIIGQFRATITPMPIYFAVILGLCAYLPKLKSLQSQLKRTAFALVIVGISSNLIYGFVNKLAIGNFFLGRKHVAHSFLMGMGESSHWYSQKHQLNGSDMSVYDMYWRAHPQLVRETDTTITAFMDPHYLSWTRAQAREVVTQNTGLYSKLVFERIIRIIFPNFRFSLVADVDAYTIQEPEDVKKERMDLIKSNKKFSAKTWARIWKISPTFFLDYILRIFTLLSFPFGLIVGGWALFKEKQTQEQLLTAALMFSFFAFFCVSLPLIRTPNFDHAAGWSVCFPVVAYGWVQAFIFCARRGLQRFRKESIGSKVSRFFHI